MRADTRWHGQHANHGMPRCPPLQALLLPLSVRDWCGMAAILTQGLYAALLFWLTRWRPSLYAQRRTLLVVSALVLHVLVSLLPQLAPSRLPGGSQQRSLLFVGG